jgi:DNA-binding NarL/FixJ family response regulator
MQRKILLLVCEGYSTATIAKKNKIKGQTVRLHLTKTYKKLGITNSHPEVIEGKDKRFLARQEAVRRGWYFCDCADEEAKKVA